MARRSFSFSFAEFVFLILLFLSGLALAFSGGGFVVNFQRVGFSVVTSLQKAVYSVCDGVTGVFTAVAELKSLKAENQELKEKLAKQIKTENQTLQLVGDLVQPSDLIILVIPIDSAAPKGRLILPQQQVLRDILEAGGAAICVKETELSKLLTDLGNRPSMVITDSQAFAQVSQVVPEEILLTSFSILMARYKGFLDEAVQGAAAIRQLKDGDRVLISEGCTHHRQCDDIGTVKIPRWLKNYTGKNLIIETSSGREFPEDLFPFSLIIHCGGCMLNGREMKYRMKCAKDQHIPFTNYGIAIAYMQGILERSIQVFPDLVKKIKFDL